MVSSQGSSTGCNADLKAKMPLERENRDKSYVGDVLRDDAGIATVKQAREIVFGQKLEKLGASHEGTHQSLVGPKFSFRSSRPPSVDCK